MTIQELLKDKSISIADKKIAVEKWKFNELPAWYRKDNRQNILQKIERLKNLSIQSDTVQGSNPSSGGGLNDDFSLEVVDSDPIPVNPSRESSAKKYREMTFNSPPRHEITPQSTTDDGFDDPSRHDVTGSTPFSVNPSGDPPRREFTKNDPQPVMQARNLPKPVISELFEKSDVPEWSDIG